MKNWKTFKKDLLKDKRVKKEYDRLTPRYQLASELINARLKRGLSQSELAEKVGTKQSAIARIESGNENLSIDSVEKISSALGAHIKISIG